MKNLFKKTMLFAAAAMAFVSCSNDDTNDVNLTPGVEVSINATTTDTEVSRSAFGDYNATDKTYPTLWEGNESWFVAVNNKYVEEVSDITFSDDLKSANVNFTLQETPTADSEGKYTLRALSPASAWSSYNLANDYMRFYIARNIQNPTATSCDPASQVLFAKSEAVESADSFNVSFEHLSAYCNFSFSNVAEGGVVNSVTISSEDVNLAGRYQYTPSTGVLSEFDRLEKSITLTTDRTENLWFALAPVDVSGKNLTFTITTDKGALTRDVPMPAVAKFESGKVVTFTIDMAGIEYPSAEEGETWYLVTNVADVTDGEYFIAGKSQEGNTIYLPSTTNTSSAPSQKAINVTGLDLSSTDEFTTTLIPEDARFTFSGSASAMTITNAEGKYLYATDTNNGLRIGTTNVSWIISANPNNAKALVFKVNTSEWSRYISLYKSQDWRSYNAIKSDAYDGNGASGSVFLYKKFSTDPMISASNIAVAAVGGNGEATYRVQNMSDDVTASTTAEWLTVVAGDSTILWEAEPNYTGDARSAEVVLTSAGASVSKTITVSQAADVFTVSPTEISLGADAEATAKFTVNSTYEFTLTNPDADKLSLSHTSGEGTVEITVTARTENTLAEVLTLGDIVVTRAGDNATKEVAVEQKAASTGGEPAGGTHFVKVTSAPSDWSGTYLIVYETGNLAFDGSLTTLDAGKNFKSITINNKQVEATDAMKAIAFTIEKNGTSYTIKSASSYYIGQTSKANGLKSSTTTKYDHTISFVNENDITISISETTLRYNANSGDTNQRFRYYKSGQQAIQLYKLN